MKVNNTLNNDNLQMQNEKQSLSIEGEQIAQNKLNNIEFNWCQYRYCLEKINKVCIEKLDLELNQKTQIGLAYNGIDFLGFNHILTNSGKVIRKLRFSSKQRMRKHIKTIRKLKDKSVIDEKYVGMRINAFKAHLKHSNEKSMDKLLSNLDKKI